MNHLLNLRPFSVTQNAINDKNTTVCIEHNAEKLRCGRHYYGIIVEYNAGFTSGLRIRQVVSLFLILNHVSAFYAQLWIAHS